MLETSAGPAHWEGASWMTSHGTSRESTLARKGRFNWQALIPSRQIGVNPSEHESSQTRCLWQQSATHHGGVCSVANVTARSEVQMISYAQASSIRVNSSIHFSEFKNSIKSTNSRWSDWEQYDTKGDPCLSLRNARWTNCPDMWRSPISVSYIR